MSQSTKKPLIKNTKVNDIIKDYILVVFFLSYLITLLKNLNWNFFQQSTLKNNGFNSSKDLAGEISRVFNKTVSSSHIRKLKRELSKIFI